MRHNRLLATAVIAMLIVIGCTADDGRTQDTVRPPETIDQVLAMTEVSFNGDNSRKLIEERLQQALTLYNVPLTADGYSRAASTLITLRQSTGQDEMAILAYMIKSHTPGTTMGFPEMAALSASFLKAGDR
jgi:hypothetical protein